MEVPGQTYYKDLGSIVQGVGSIPAFGKVKSSNSANGLLPKQPHGDR
jgi:hypothetical protein